MSKRGVVVVLMERFSNGSYHFLDEKEASPGPLSFVVT